MASVEANKLSKADHDELCCSYAALMLHDDGLEITVSLLYFKCFNVFSSILADLRALAKSTGQYGSTVLPEAVMTWDNLSAYKQRENIKTLKI
jgi:hypothetical protein